MEKQLTVKEAVQFLGHFNSDDVICLLDRDGTIDTITDVCAFMGKPHNQVVFSIKPFSDPFKSEEGQYPPSEENPND